MWNKRRDEEPPKPYTPPPSPAPVAPSPIIETKKEITPVSSMPMGKFEPPTSTGSAATIGKAVKVVGQIYSKEDLYVDGEVEGSITLRGQTLTIGPNGRVRANIEARNVIVHGRLDGDIHATERVELRKSAALTGDIATARISIEDGAFFKGGIDIQKAEPAPKIEAKPQTVAATAPVPMAAQGTLLEPKKI